MSALALHKIPDRKKNAVNLPLKLFRGRTNRVDIAGACSNTNSLNFDVPQGSVIGPRSFTMYMASVGDILRKHDIKFHMYADDIQVFLDFVPTIPGEVACCLHKLFSCISDVQKWMLRNKLKLNEDKTEVFIASYPSETISSKCNTSCQRLFHKICANRS